MEKIIWNEIKRLFISGWAAIGFVVSVKSAYEALVPEGTLFEDVINAAYVAVVLCVVVVLWVALKDVRAFNGQKHKVTGANKTLSVYVGNGLLRKKDGSILLGVNDELTCERSLINSRSIHYQILEKYRKYGDNWMVDRFKEEHDRQIAQHGKVMYGHSFEIESPDARKHSFVFLVTSTLTNPRTPNAPTQDLKTAIQDFFQNPHTYNVRHNKLYFSLAGTGAAGNTLNKQALIEYIAYQYVNSTTNIQEVVISILPDTLTNDLNFDELHQRLQDIAERCVNGQKCCPYDPAFLL